MATKASVTKITEDKIIEMYMDFVLEHEVHPKSIYKFCKAHKIKEATFYGFFGSFAAIRKRIWTKFHDNTYALLEQNKEYEGYDNKDKMLTYFYTIFELLTLNRSYVLFSLGEENQAKEKLLDLKEMRTRVKDFATALIDVANAGKTLKITKQSPKIFSEGAWVQFLFLLRFWINDGSPGFEKTDMAIEKSVTTIFDVFDNTPINNLVDFGKFLYKENFA